MKDARFLITLLLLMMVSAAYGQVESWSGELDVEGIKLPLVFNLSDEGCTMDSPAQGAKGIKAEKSISPEGVLTIKVPSIGATYEGVMVMNMITGKFTQNGMSFPLTLKPGVAKPNRPQTPVPPFPYRTEEVTFQNGEVQLNGTLTLPENCTEQTPVILMVTGSGLQNRDEEMMDHKPFAVIADALAREGIATLRYDDRGYGVEGFPYLQFTTYHSKTDALVGIHLLRERFRKVGVMGHSEGGTIALMLASEGKVDFAISLAGMAVSGKETLLKQSQAILSTLGFSESDVTAYCNTYEHGMDELLKGTPAEEIPIPEMHEGLKKDLAMALKQCATPYMLHLLTVDVRETLPQVTCPVLALNGTKDMQVDCTANLGAIDKGLQKSKHQTIAVEGVNHLFQHCQTGAPTEYSQIEETFAPEAISHIIAWLKSSRQ